MVVLNLILTWVCWTWAKEAFDAGHNKLGWWHIFCSAFNAAVVALFVLK